MEPIAITMMVIAIMLIFGPFVVAVTYLLRHPDPYKDNPDGE
ncbi:methionine/alanine import family NSS transporter small subunit [Natronoglycomyces albus]|uniref:Methionine/alanine import family NSS transporter small subunit n=1 Tax=Natronoglycomyces albus TaxID=2811108 RepID=A0A895XLR3_9ACTN|nr:methionine/alanine import family NSS transporter small subunit [Natronoglycomyces albus]QSB06284.1 methionine/alanine import family NSS transporter small subunit [Natronoglycomyces albus]